MFSECVHTRVSAIPHWAKGGSKKRESCRWGIKPCRSPIGFQSVPILTLSNQFFRFPGVMNRTITFPLNEIFSSLPTSIGNDPMVEDFFNDEIKFSINNQRLGWLYPPIRLIWFEKRNMKDRMDFPAGRQLKLVCYIADHFSDRERSNPTRQKLIRSGGIGSMAQFDVCSTEEYKIPNRESDFSPMKVSITLLTLLSSLQVLLSFRQPSLHALCKNSGSRDPRRADSGEKRERQSWVTTVIKPEGGCANRDME
jgi:hypothetical protein